MKWLLGLNEVIFGKDVRRTANQINNQKNTKHFNGRVTGTSIIGQKRKQLKDILINPFKQALSSNTPLHDGYLEY